MRRARRSRRATPGCSAYDACPGLRRDPDVLRPDDAVGRLLVALQLAAVREDQRLVIEIDQRLVGLDLCDRLLVGRLALPRIGVEPRLVERGLRRLVAVLAPVERRVAAEVIDDVLVGIEASAPADQIDLEVALYG